MTDRIRIDEPSYVARYRESARRGADAVDDDPSLPSYVRQYRARGVAGGASVRVEADEAPLQRAVPALAPTVRSIPEIASDVYLVRHAETVGGEAGEALTDQGRWQARSYGRTLAKQLREGEEVVIRHADTPRARQTADEIRAGVAEACDEAGRSVRVVAPEPMAEFQNTRFAGPDGLVELSDAFRAHERERVARPHVDLGDRPLWFVELDRYWKLQLAGADPIEKWITTPMLHFEPPSMVVRRLWVGIDRLSRRYPKTRLVVVTHSSCVRALAVAALGYDPGEPYNTEHVQAKVFAGRTDALVSYRNRHQEICVPDIADLPVWNTTETWQPPVRSAPVQEAAS